MENWEILAGTCGIFFSNVLFLSVRTFASSRGLQVRWWSRSLARERAHLRTLASSADPDLARLAGRYLRIEILAWILALASMVFFVVGVARR